MPAPPAPLLLVLDGNSLMHRAYHAAATGKLVDGDGRAVWALKGLVGYIARAAATLRPDAVLVGFDCPDDSFRKADFPGYKAQRPAKPADLVEQLAAAPTLLRSAGISTVVVPAHEADDVLASAAATARRRGWRSILVTSDRDSFALVDESTSILRIRNGGLDEAVLLTAESFVEVCGVLPRQYRDLAALRGDPSDNLPGVRGFGTATAGRLLAEFGSVDAAWDALDAGDHASVRAVVGENARLSLHSADMRANVMRNRRLMLMRTDLALPDLDTTRLPVDRLRMRRVLAERGIILGPSLWALVGGAPPITEPPVVAFKVPRPWVWTRSRRGRDPAPGQLALF